MKILITGGSGLLGQYLNVSLSQSHDILTIYNSHVGNCSSFNSQKINLRNQYELKKVFNDYKPQVVLHSAAITSTLLDNKYSLADYFKTNVEVTELIAKLSSLYKSKLIYISTDLVYDGNRGSFLTEEAKLNPISPYAESKLIGEEKVKEFSENYNILRLALLIGFGLNHSVSHFQTLYKNLMEHKPVYLFTDQFRTPISLLEASLVIKRIIEIDIPNGVYNLGGNERISRFQIGEMLAEKIEADKSLLVPTSLSDNPIVPNVKDVSMSNDKLTAIGIKINPLEKMIDDIISFYQNKF
jgi:dTDP-4-dehydrorhamnose reductase